MVLARAVFILVIVTPAASAPAAAWQEWAWLDYDSSTPCEPLDPHACYGNGECSGGVCTCEVGWRGAYCSQLDLMPARRSASGLPMNSAMPTWGGSAAFDGAQWHFLTGAKLYDRPLTAPNYEEWQVHGLSAAPSPDAWGRVPPYNHTAAAAGADPYSGSYPWEFATTTDPYATPELYGSSYVVRLVSSGADAAGPYTMAAVEHKAFRADFKRAYGASATDPLYLLTIGTVVGASSGRGMLIKRSASGAPTGPWEEKVVYEFAANGHGANYSQWDCDVKDPSFVVHANGTTVIAYRAVCCDPCGDHTERVGLLVAPSWDGLYARVGVPIFADGDHGGEEDLFMWLTAKGTHMIFHSQATDHGTVRGPSFGSDHKKKRGGAAFSADGQARWSKSDWELFPSEIAWDDGTTTFLLKQQRPSLIFDPATGQPTHLVSGVDSMYDPCCSWYIYGSAWTLIQPLVTQCRAGSLADGAGSGQCFECRAADIGCGRCTVATTKYGRCVCAQCASGWRGDRCDERDVVCRTGMNGVALDAAVDSGLESRRECAGGDAADRVTLIATADAPSLAECSAACAAHVRQWNQLGCCYSFQGTNKACYFTPRATLGSNSGALRFAALCELEDASVPSCPSPSPPLPATPLSPSISGDDASYTCMGNGIVVNGACKCDAGWKGFDCAVLDLLPVRSAHSGWSQELGATANWGASTIREGDTWHWLVGAKADHTDGASDLFALNSGMLLLRSDSGVGGPFMRLSEMIGLNGQRFGFRVDAKRHPIDGALLVLTEGFAFSGRWPNSEGFGFIFLRSASGSVHGPWTEHLVYELGRNVSALGGIDYTADASNDDDARWDCRLADPTFVVLPSGEMIVAYRGTKCCCDGLIGAWSNTGEHELETVGLLRAPAWDGPYTRDAVPIFGSGTDNEDPFLWTSERGVHMLMHSQDNSHHNHERRGAYAFSPDGGPHSWRLSPVEAWDSDGLHFDNCSSRVVVKRQRPSLAFDPHSGRPTHFLSGVATSSHGLEWGDGWTAVQPLNGASVDDDEAACTPPGSACCEKPCPAGSVAVTEGSCAQCTDADVPSCKAGQVTSTAARDACACRECTAGLLGPTCDVAADASSSTCPHDGWKLLPGTEGGALFRCGGVADLGTPAAFATGYFGHCVPIGARCDSAHSNCGDATDESDCPVDHRTSCAWPTVRDADGLCSLCTDGSVQRCAMGEAAPNATQDVCKCLRCEVGWLGPQCDVVDTAMPPPAAPPESPAAPVRFVTNSTASGNARGGSGTLEDPYTSLQQCVDELAALEPGSSCQLLGGRYRLNATVMVRDLHGAGGSHYEIRAAPGHEVTIDGTVVIDGPWSWVASDGVVGGHWSAPLPDGVSEPWQLFVEDEMFVVARWPNARWDTKTMFLAEHWAQECEPPDARRRRGLADATEAGNPCGASGPSTYCGSEQRGGNPDGLPCVIADGGVRATGETLASSGINATGASAVLNIGQ